QKVQLPVPVAITAHVTRFQQSRLVAASYAFNPRMYGCDAPMSRSWKESPWHKDSIEADPQRVRFVDSVTEWGKVVQGHFDALIAARRDLALQRRTGNELLDAALPAAVARRSGMLLRRHPGERRVAPLAGDRVVSLQDLAVDHDAAARAGAEDRAEHHRRAAR